MKLLLDTHTFIWAVVTPAKLSPAAIVACQDPANTLWLSVASVWEMQIKVMLKKLSFAPSLRQVLVTQESKGLQMLPVELHHIWELEQLPSAHKDPFDRLLAAQTRVEGMTLVSADPIFAQYPVAILW
jgi:PIN domain nuclease of toxin-antitoxin system